MSASAAKRGSQGIRGLEFIPLQLECYDLVLRKKRRGETAFMALLEILSTEEYKRDIARPAGFDVSQPAVSSPADTKKHLETRRTSPALRFPGVLHWCTIMRQPVYNFHAYSLGAFRVPWIRRGESSGVSSIA
jgi:hypothetical protein